MLGSCLSEVFMVIVQAIFDYNGSADHKIQFVKGDTFELVDDTDPNWWHVTLPRRQEQEVPEHIYVPATYVEKFEGRISTADVSILAFYHIL